MVERTLSRNNPAFSPLEPVFAEFEDTLRVALMLWQPMVG